MGGPDFAVGELEVRRIELSETHVQWWNEAAECAGAVNDRTTLRRTTLRMFEVVRPLTPSGQQFACYEPGRLCSGVWDPPGDIYVASGMLNSERTVKHEMSHVMIPTYDHPPVFFRCASPLAR